MGRWESAATVPESTLSTLGLLRGLLRLVLDKVCLKLRRETRLRLMREVSLRESMKGGLGILLSVQERKLSNALSP